MSMVLNTSDPADWASTSISAMVLIGWAVCQKGDNENEWFPITFGSRTIRGSEVNYPINALEQLAVVEGYKKNYHMLNGRKVYIFCDNKPSVDKAAKSEKRILNAIQDMINETSAEIIHIEGDKNELPDFLSRYNAPRVNEIICYNAQTDSVYLEKIVTMQQEDDEIKGIIKSIKNGTMIKSDNFGNLNLELVRGKDGDILFMKDVGEKEKEILKPIIPMKSRYQYVVNTHLDPLVGHLQRFQLEEKVKKFAYVKHLKKVILEVIQLCMRCQQTRDVPLSKQMSNVESMPIPHSIGERWHFDILGPFTMETNDEFDASYNEEKDKTKQYVIGAIEEVSKYLVTRVIPSKRTKDVVDFLLCDIIYKFGVPTILTSDNAKEFFSKVMNEIMAMLNIKRIHTSRFSPRANGVIEVRWRHLKKIIKRNYALDDMQNLKRIVSAATFALNQWICSSTNYAPNAVLFNFMPSSPTMFPLYHQDITQKAIDQKLIDDERQRISLLKLIRTTILNKQIIRNKQANKSLACRQFDCKLTRCFSTTNLNAGDGYSLDALRVL